MDKIKLNEIYNIDALAGLKLLPDASVDLVIIDPPYSFHAGGGGMAKDRQYLKDIKGNSLNDGFDFNIMNELKRVLKKINLYVFCNKTQIKQYLDFIDVNGYNWVLICWHKKNPIPLINNTFLPDSEYIIYMWKDYALGGDYESKKKFYITDIEKNDFNHPTVKPLHIIRNFVKNSSWPGDVVLDCFSGSGTTALACKQLGRNFIGFDINQEYCEIARDRLKQRVLTCGGGLNGYL